jgi:hypothetical protein
LNSIAAQCPLRSNREELSMSTCFPLCARTRTLLDAVGMSQKCHVWTFAYHAYHSIIASARSRNVSGTVNSSSLAVLRLTVVR